MAARKPTAIPDRRALLRFALRLPGAEESVACAGTVIEKRTVRSGGKAFLFVGPKDLMLKLGPSLAEAQKLALEKPENCRTGSGGWVSLRFEDELPLAAKRLEGWVRESHALLGGGAATRARKPKR